MILDHNRITVEVEISLPGGMSRKVKAWVDTGGTKFTVSETLARELGFDLSGRPAESGRPYDTSIPVPGLSLGGFPLETTGMAVSVYPGRFSRPGVVSDCTLPARLFRGRHIVFDYPERVLTVARPGVLAPKGEMIPILVNPETGLFMIEAEFKGEKAALGLDTGSAGTWISARWIAAREAGFPSRPKLSGAAGSTNFFGFPFETRGDLLSLAALRIGSMTVDPPVAVLGLDQGIFDWYSGKSAASVAGFLGGEPLSRYRMEADLSAGKSWWTPGPTRSGRDLDLVPLTVKAEDDGTFTIAGIVARDGRPLLEDVKPGDALLGVDGLDAAKAAMGAVIDALRGTPGDPRILRVRRDGRMLEIRARVLRLGEKDSARRSAS